MEAPDTLHHLPADLAPWIIDACRDPIFVFDRRDHRLAAYNQAAAEHLKRQTWVQESEATVQVELQAVYRGSKCTFRRYLPTKSAPLREERIGQERIDQAIQAWEADHSGALGGVRHTNQRRMIMLVLDSTPHDAPVPWIEPVASSTTHYALMLRAAPDHASARFKRHLERRLVASCRVGDLATVLATSPEQAVEAALDVFDSWILHKLNLQLWCKSHLKRNPVAQDGRTLAFGDPSGLEEGSATQLWKEWAGGFASGLASNNSGALDRVLAIWSDVLGASTKDGANTGQLVWKALLLGVPGE